MNKAVLALTSRLTYGTNVSQHHEEHKHGIIETLASVYEKARNALEYRAENLVRRAAIERILKRLIILNKDPTYLSENLLTELSWARYLSKSQITPPKQIELTKILNKYTSYSGSVIPMDWIIKIASAEIEEVFNLNKDYSQFTFFTFQAIKQKVTIVDENLDLLIFFAVDKVYAASDPEQIAYHIISLAGADINDEKMEEGWKLFKLASQSKTLPRINKFVRRQMPPLILLRDIYFYNPNDFKKTVSDKELFLSKASEVLDNQLEQMTGRIGTAGFRSVLYVFLTKMVLAFGVEAPLEMLILGRLAMLPLIINLIFPPLLMWFATMQIKVPSQKERDLLVNRSWFIVENFDELKLEQDLLGEAPAEDKTNIIYWIFTTIYTLFFIGTFAFIYYILGLIGFTFLSKFIFVFFLTVIAFFAYRINQIAQVYSWKGIEHERSHLTDTVALPILTIGSILSNGLSKLNFLGFVFDFILEAPFKLILGFVDDWVQFLSVKKEQQILD